MTRAAKRDVDREALRASWRRQEAALGFDARALAAEAAARQAGRDAEKDREPAAGPAGAAAAWPAGRDAPVQDRPAGGNAGRAPAGERGAEPDSGPPGSASRAVDWAVAHLSEREAVFARTDLLAAALALSPGAAAIGDIEREVAAREKAGALHAARLPGADGLLTTDRAVADERETIALMQAGERRGAAPMRARAVDKALRNGPLTRGQSNGIRICASR